MKFKEGQSGNPTGKPKGAKNKISTEMRELLKLIIEKEINSIPLYLSKIKKPDTRLKILIELLPYVLPKLQNTDLKIESNNTVAITGMQIISKPQ
jgi:hypothetical protein